MRIIVISPSGTPLKIKSSCLTKYLKKGFTISEIANGHDGERTFGSYAGGKGLTFVFPDECVSEECEKEVTVPMIVDRGKKNKYLRFQVEDIKGRGLNAIDEILWISQQILQDFDTKTISKLKALDRLRGIRSIVKKTKNGELGSNEGKKAALKIITYYENKIKEVKKRAKIIME